MDFFQILVVGVLPKTTRRFEFKKKRIIKECFNFSRLFSILVNIPFQTQHMSKQKIQHASATHCTLNFSNLISVAYGSLIILVCHYQTLFWVFEISTFVFENFNFVLVPYRDKLQLSAKEASVK